MLSVDAFSTAQMRLAAGLRTDLLCELERSPDLLPAIGGRDPTSKGKGGKGRGRVKEGGKGGEEEKGMGGDCLLFI